MDQTGPSSDILWSHVNHVDIARVLIGWILPTHVCQSFTRQIGVYQHEKVGEKVGENRGKFYLSPTVCQRVCRQFLCRSHTPIWVCQHEFANFSLPCEGRLRFARPKHLLNTSFVLPACMKYNSEKGWCRFLDTSNFEQFVHLWSHSKGLSCLAACKTRSKSPQYTW